MCRTNASIIDFHVRIIARITTTVRDGSRRIHERKERQRTFTKKNAHHEDVENLHLRLNANAIRFSNRFIRSRDGAQNRFQIELRI